jgi:GNAT superfamily N-acetyltransferase
MTLAIALAKRPSKADRDAVGHGLVAYNHAAYGRITHGERWFLARDAAGAVQAGAKCEESAGWLYVDRLWVAEPLRRQGWGGRLLAAAEDYGRERKLVGIHLNTASFQAPDYYPKHGFVCIGRLEDRPPGAVQYWFAKRL